MRLEGYLDAAACPAQRPEASQWGPRTRELHTAVDARIRATGVAHLHPDGPTVQTDLLGGAGMLAWQEDKTERVMMGEVCWSSMPQIYSRYGTAAGRHLAALLGELERAPAVILTDSGMQAVALLLDVALEPGSHVLMSRQVYNKSKAYLDWMGQRINLDVELIDDLSPETLRRLVRAETSLVFAETYTNPLMRALDPAALSASVVELRQHRARGLRSCIDHTIATPWALRRPLLSFAGIDVVVTSGTKAMGGQDRDMWGYVASARVELLNQMMDLQAMRGGVVSWRVAEVVAAGLERARALFERRCATATRIAAFLAGHPRVETIFHPSRDTYRDRDVVARHYRLPGSLMSFRLRDTDEDATGHFCDVLATTTVVRYALSFDGLTTKVNHHKTVSEYHTPEAALKKQGIDRLVRFGVGVEDPEDLIAALNWALWHAPELSTEDVIEWQRHRREQLGL